jgi:hypothetical protein
MKVFRCESVLTGQNVDAQIASYLSTVTDLGASLGQLRGVALFEALKRSAVKSGPYPHVTLFEAANRIMTDLVLLYGVRWLLRSKKFPVDSYTVEYGHENNNGFDVMAEKDGIRVVGEAFNVAPSFFQGKKSAMLNKLRKKGIGAAHSLLLFNHDAMPEGYRPSLKAKEHHIFVHVGEGRADMVPNKPLQPIARKTRSG